VEYMATHRGRGGGMYEKFTNNAYI